MKSWTNTTWCCQVYEELHALWSSDDSRHTLWIHDLSIITVPIALIHSEHVFEYITEMLRVAIGLSWQQTRRARSHCDQMTWKSKWPTTYYSSHYCINAMKQYRCVAKIQITLYCNMANRSSFARYCCIIIRMTIDDWCCIFAFDVLII